MLRSIREETEKNQSRKAVIIDHKEIERMKLSSKIETPEDI